MVLTASMVFGDDFHKDGIAQGWSAVSQGLGPAPGADDPVIENNIRRQKYYLRC